jgi:RHS repeat-associated protein
VTSSLLNSTASGTTADSTPGASRLDSGTSTFDHSGIKNADTQTDDGGDVSAIRRYDAFGNPVAAWGGWQGPFGYGGPYGYQTDGDHGLMLLGHRYYEADTGRFLTRDPIKEGRNWYGYCGGSPNMLADPAGLRKIGDNGNEPLPRPIQDLPPRPIPDEPNNLWRWIGNYFRDAYDWWSGTDVIGPGGEPVRIGGWPAFLIRDDYAVTLGGTVHLKDYDDFYNSDSGGYINSKYWWRHEVRHIWQEDQVFGGSTTEYVKASIIGYILAGSHDGAPLEIDADNHSGWNTPPRNVFGGGAWPYVMGGRESTTLWR